MIKRLLLVVGIATLFSCLPDPPDKRGFTRAQLRRLLSFDGQKAWLLTERKVNGEPIDLLDCGFEQILLFRAIGNLNNVDSLYYINFALNCESPIQVSQISGRYFIPLLQPFEDTQDTVYLFINNDTIESVVDRITFRELSIRYQYDSLNYLEDEYLLFEPEED